MLIHIPLDNDKKHFAFLSQEIELTKLVKLEYGERLVNSEFIRQLLAGLYGFTSLEKRDLFIRQCNGAEGIECCYPAMITTASVV